MNITSRTLKILRLCIITACLANSVKAEIQPRTDINPALLYWQAFSIFPELAETNRNALYQESPPDKISPEEIEIGRLFDASFRLINRAARMTAPCDWGVNLADGPEMVTPNIIKVRIASRAVELRARVALAEGRPDDAVNEITAVLVLVRSIARNDLLVQVMIQISIEESLIQFVAAHADAWSTAHWQALQSAFAGKESRVTTQQAVASERGVFLDWMLAHLTDILEANDGDEDAALQQGLEFWRQFDWDDESVELLRRESGGTGTGLVAAVRSTTEVYHIMDALSSAPPREWQARKEDLDRYLTNHPLARAFTPNMAKARAVEFRLLSRVAMIDAYVAYRADGLEGLRRVPDPYGAGPFRLERTTQDERRHGFYLRSALDLPDIDPSLFFSDAGVVP